ncbi:MAG: hypothetical protein WAV73_04580 [Candidatus Moraniibacteriota bacterium]
MKEEGRTLKVFVAKGQTLRAFLTAINVDLANVEKIKIGCEWLFILTSEIAERVLVSKDTFVEVLLKKGVYVGYCPYSV